MAVDYTGKVLTQAPYGISWATKVDIDPGLAETARKEFRTHNHLYNLKHRGYSGLPPEGDQRNVYSVYRNWAWENGSFSKTAMDRMQSYKGGGKESWMTMRTNCF